MNVKLPRRSMHETITMDRILNAVTRWNTTTDNPGFCLACGADADECEPDARRYKCKLCGAHDVYGAEEVLMMAA